MKSAFIRLFSLMLAVIPMAAASQNNIKKAFDDIIKCPQAQITERHTLDRDPSTGAKTGQCDIYNFVLPEGKAKLVENVMSAFEKDSDTAFGINRGSAANGEKEILLAVGNGEGDGVQINKEGGEYAYSLYLAPLSEDPDGIYRYAYGIEYKKEDGKLTGRLVITYATTLKYRQQEARERQFEVLRNFSNGSTEIVMSKTNAPQESWFDKLMSCFQSMTQANSQTRIALASKAYKVIRDTSNYPDVTDSDKETVREVLRGMISEKKYSETVLNKLLNQCLVGLK